MSMQIEADTNWAVGDIIKVQGRDHKILKKTSSAISVSRYFFWNKWWDRFMTG